MRGLILGAMIAAAASPAAAADVRQLFLGGSQYNEQVGNVVTLRDASFFAAADLTREDVSGVELVAPSGFPLPLNADGVTSFLGSYSYADYPGLVADFGDGSYTLNLSTFGGDVLAHAVDIAFAGLARTPEFTDPLAFDGMLANQDFTVSINGFAPPAGVDGTSFLYVYGDNFFYSQNFLDAGTTSLLLPANTLGRGKTYRAELIFTSRTYFSTADIGAVIAFADNRTSLDFTTSAVPEPGAWAMMIVGFGLVGAGLRSKRARALAV